MSNRKILIDLIKLRDIHPSHIEGFEPSLLNNDGLRTIREIAAFRYTCRKCGDAPCITVCPAEALEKDENKFVTRAINLCIRCKSCISVCPFGTIMNDLFEPKTSGYQLYDLSDENERQKFVDGFPAEIVSMVDAEENPEQHVYQLSDHVLVKDYMWFH